LSASSSVLFKGRTLIHRGGKSGGQVIARLANWLEIIGQVYDGSLALRCVYSVRRYRPETVQALMDAYRAELEALIDHCLEQVG